MKVKKKYHAHFLKVKVTVATVLYFSLPYFQLVFDFLVIC